MIFLLLQVSTHYEIFIKIKLPKAAHDQKAMTMYQVMQRDIFIYSGIFHEGEGIGAMLRFINFILIF